MGESKDFVYVWGKRNTRGVSFSELISLSSCIKNKYCAFYDILLKSIIRPYSKLATILISFVRIQISPSNLVVKLKSEKNTLR